MRVWILIGMEEMKSSTWMLQLYHIVFLSLTVSRTFLYYVHYFKDTRKSVSKGKKCTS